MQMQHYDHFLKLLGYAICVCVCVCECQYNWKVPSTGCMGTLLN